MAQLPFDNFSCRRGADHENFERGLNSEVTSESVAKLRLCRYFLSHLQSIFAEIPSWPYSFLCNIRVQLGHLDLLSDPRYPVGRIESFLGLLSHWAQVLNHAGAISDCDVSFEEVVAAKGMMI
ncbi:hypothetical protein AAC387_Pa11g0640 [Persea americana]